MVFLTLEAAASLKLKWSVPVDEGHAAFAEKKKKTLHSTLQKGVSLASFRDYHAGHHHPLRPPAHRTRGGDAQKEVEMERESAGKEKVALADDVYGYEGIVGRKFSTAADQ